MKRLLVLVMVVGCGPVKVNEPGVSAPSADVDKLRKDLATVTAERDELREKLKQANAAVLNAADKPTNTTRDQKLAVGRYIMAQRQFDFQVAVGGMSADAIDELKHIDRKAKSGAKISAAEYLAAFNAVRKEGGQLPPGLMLSVDWSDAPEVRDFNREYIDFAEKLQKATSDDEKAMLYFDFETEQHDHLKDVIAE